ncbi:hypothetical protein TSUD_160530 [Trifolium subterraneum]|uniref:Uncharacterized protein n=1 Tax=Trifolium subterraneum TaxID=3900 RepID=A0A2Z6NFL3_TRISU|nr:hypothetical protein TSUD_160530 [Trifolium subterraneum]
MEVVQLLVGGVIVELLVGAWNDINSIRHETAKEVDTLMIGSSYPFLIQVTQ